MEFRNFTFFFSVIALLLLPPLFSYSVSARSNPKQHSPFEFLTNLQGTRKNDKINGIHQLKMYLRRFGYLPKTNSREDDDDYFDEITESAIKTYELNHNLKVTGTLNAETVSTMAMPRCGFPDIINGTTRMHSGRQFGNSHYTFFPGNPKWTLPEKQNLTYAFLPGTSSDTVSAVASALAKWATVTTFTSSLVEDYNGADIKISFQRWDHGDGVPFDGPRGVLAHAFAPMDGRLHFDADENWVVGAVPESFDLETVALHELGHILGLGHSSHGDAIMFPNIGPGMTKGLSPDDIQGIQALYN